MNGTRQVPVAEGLFTWPSDHPRLNDRGALWTFTTQDFRPPSPPYDGADTFQPYAVGYVELPGELMVEARLTEPDPARLAIGQPMRLTIVPYRVSADGTQVMTFAFTPTTEA